MFTDHPKVMAATPPVTALLEALATILTTSPSSRSALKSMSAFVPKRRRASSTVEVCDSTSYDLKFS